MPHVITLTGPSGSGKSTAVDDFLDCANNSFKPALIPKYKTRPARQDDKKESIFVKDIPEECDLVYEQYEERYGLESEMLFGHLEKGYSPIVILNDVRTVEEVQAALGEVVRSVFIFRKVPILKDYRNLAQSRNVFDEEDIYKRFNKAQSIYRIYIENIHLFDHVIINSGSRGELRRQARQVVRGLKQKLNWPLR